MYAGVLHSLIAYSGLYTLIKNIQTLTKKWSAQQVCSVRSPAHELSTVIVFPVPVDEFFKVQNGWISGVKLL